MCVCVCGGGGGGGALTRGLHRSRVGLGTNRNGESMLRTNPRSTVLDSLINYTASKTFFFKFRQLF